MEGPRSPTYVIFTTVPSWISFCSLIIGNMDFSAIFCYAVYICRYCWNALMYLYGTYTECGTEKSIKIIIFISLSLSMYVCGKKGLLYY